ncbi:MAG: zf-TFIIB domain-containing protein [Clostridia bacterium]|nr:zf-TFIIB domain-containing protein [Clostridia bacterium]
MKCPLCNGNMKYIQYRDTHIWSCEECAGILFEFVEDKNYEQLGEHLEIDRTERFKTLLSNAIVMLEDEQCLNLRPKSHYLLNELGMTEKEYDEVLGNKHYLLLGIKAEDLRDMHDNNPMGELEFWLDHDKVFTQQTINEIVKEKTGKECWTLAEMCEQFDLLDDTDGEEFDECLLDILNTIEEKWGFDE